MKRFIAVLTALLMLTASATAETVWVLCQPNSQVNIRSRASGRSEIVGYATCADDFQTDGVQKYGFLHVYAPVEAGEGWIACGYVVFSEPVYIGRKMAVNAKGRVNARRTIGGKRRCWVQPGTEVMVYWAAEWAVTDRGFIKSDFVGEW